MLYCSKCDTFSELSYSLVCMDCGQTLTTCWWALCHRIDAVKEYCNNCKNRYWCWTHRIENEKRLPSYTQAKIVQNAEFEHLCTWLDGEEGG